MPKTAADTLAEFDRNELLWKAIDRAVLAGRMVVGAGQDAYDLYHDKCVVDAATQQVTLNHRPLDEALTEIIAKRPLWKPTGPDPRVAEQQELEAAALAGGVTAHGRLFKTMGTTDAERRINYAAWCAAHAVKPGEAAKADATGDDKGRDDQGRFVAAEEISKNPWKSPDFRTNKAAQAAAAGIIKRQGTKFAASLARAAGKTIDGSAA